MTDDRSERLRKRRKESAKQPAQNRESETAAADADTPSEKRKTNGDTADTNGQTGENDSVKDKQVGTYMYLPEAQTKDLRRVYNILKAEYEFKYDTEFEKNRHFYPLVIQYGLDSLDGMDASEIRNKLDELE